MKSILKQVYIIGCMAEKRDSETLLESEDVYKFIKQLHVTILFECTKQLYQYMQLTEFLAACINKSIFNNMLLNNRIVIYNCFINFW